MPLLTKKTALLFLALVFALKTVLVFKVGNPDPLEVTGDAISYHNSASFFAENGIFTNPNAKWDMREPVYPLLVSAFYVVFGKNLYPIFVFQALLSVLFLVLVYKLAKSVFNEKVAVFSAFWAGIYPQYYLFEPLLFREILVYFLILLFFSQLLKLFKDNKPLKNSIAQNFLVWLTYILLVHTDARYLVLFPFIVVLIFVYLRKQFFPKTLFACVTISVLMLPWLLRNYIVYDGVVLINTRTLDLRSSSLSPRIASLKGELGNVKIIINQKYPTEAERTLIKQGQNPNNRSKEEVRAILDEKYATKSQLEKRWFNFRELWRPFRFSSEYAPYNDCRFEKPWALSHNAVGIVFYGLLLPFFVYSILSFRREKIPYALFLLTPILFQTILHVLMWGKERYRLPVDAFVIILSWYGIVKTYEKIKLRFSPTK